MKETILVTRIFAFGFVWVAGFSMLYADLSIEEKEWKEMNKSSVALFVSGEHEKAIQKMKEAIQYAENNFGQESLYMAKSLNNLGNFYLQLDQLDQAQSHYQEAITIEKSTMGEAHPLVADSLFNLAVTYAIQKETDQARKLLDQVLNIYEEQEKPDANAIKRVKNLLLQLG